MALVQYCAACGPLGEMAENAARNGHLDCLRSAKEHGCPSWGVGTCEAACIAGNLDCLVWARENGCPAGYFTAQAAFHHQKWECLVWGLANDCPVLTHDRYLRPLFVRGWVGAIVRTVVARVEREDFEARTRAARTVQRAWFRCYYDPAHPVCRRRLMRQFLSLDMHT